MNKTLSEALRETVKEIRGYSKEDLDIRLRESKNSVLAKTIDGFIEEGLKERSSETD